MDSGVVVSKVPHFSALQTMVKANFTNQAGTATPPPTSGNILHRVLSCYFGVKPMLWRSVSASAQFQILRIVFID